jgi:hypothetical protein
MSLKRINKVRKVGRFRSWAGGGGNDRGTRMRTARLGENHPIARILSDCGMVFDGLTNEATSRGRIVAIQVRLRPCEERLILQLSVRHGSCRQPFGLPVTFCLAHSFWLF